MEVVDCLTEDELDFLDISIVTNQAGQIMNVARRDSKERGAERRRTSSISI
jgi:hypothetical protein